MGSLQNWIDGTRCKGVTVSKAPFPGGNKAVNPNDVDENKPNFNLGLRVQAIFQYLCANQ
jgi:hypothetical protein